MDNTRFVTQLVRKLMLNIIFIGRKWSVKIYGLWDDTYKEPSKLILFYFVLE